MGLLSSLLGPQAAGNVSLPPSDDYWYEPRLDPNGSAGIPMSGDVALTHPTVWACVSKIAKILATLPKHVYTDEELDGGRTRRRKVDDEPATEVLTVTPNPEMTSVGYWESMWVNVLLWGAGYSEIIRNRQGDLLQLWPIPASDIEVKRDDKTDALYYHQISENRRIPVKNMFVLNGLSVNGVVGLSVIGYNRLTVGTGIAAANHTGAYYQNGTTPGLVITRSMEADQRFALDDKGERRLLGSIEARHQGSGNAWKPFMLREDMKAETLGMPMVDAQYIETRQFTRVDVCAIFDVPPILVQDTTEASYNTAEQQGLGWKTGTIVPWCVRGESAIDGKFLGEGLYFKHNVDGLARGDQKSRYEAYSLGRTFGWLSANDVRELEDMPPIEGGDEYTEQMNMGPLGGGDGGEPKPQGQGGAEAFREAFLSVTSDLCHKAEKANPTEKSRIKQQAWLAIHKNEARDKVTPILNSYSAMRGCDPANWIPDDFAGYYIDQVQNRTADPAILADWLIEQLNGAEK